jgi:DNA mismatch repair protein MutS
MTSSILDVDVRADADVARDEPAFFRDLNLDRVVADILAGREEYGLNAFFYRLLTTADAVAYRHEVLHDLERSEIRLAVAAFSDAMRAVRAALERSRKAFYDKQRERSTLDALTAYCAGVRALAAALRDGQPASRGLTSFLQFLEGYGATAAFRELAERSDILVKDLAALRYSVLVDGLAVTVRADTDRSDYGAEVHAAFARFDEGPGKSYRVERALTSSMNHVEAKIVDFVAQLYPQPFEQLHDLFASTEGFLNETIVRFDREIQFYLSVLEYLDPLGAIGSDFCYPTIAAADDEIFARAAFDVALAHKLQEAGAGVVLNDLRLNRGERIVIVTGPNQGGKTTFARACGQLFYFAALGVPVPAAQAQLPLADRILTHFEREERLVTLQGKLENDLVRIRDILAVATSQSLIIMNEIFTSTTVRDAIVLSKRIAERISTLGATCIWVTFVEEIASFGSEVASMVATVDPDDPSRRTLRVVRGPATGRSYALSLAKKYGLDGDTLRERMRQ